MKTKLSRNVPILNILKNIYYILKKLVYDLSFVIVPKFFEDHVIS